MFRIRFIIACIALILFATCTICCTNSNDTGNESSSNDETQDETSQIGDEESPDFAVWKLSLSIARNLHGDDERAVALEIIAENLAISARFEKSVNVALEIESDFIQSRVLAGISNLMLVYFEIDTAAETLEKALEACNRMPDSLDKSSALSLIASCFKTLENQEKSDEISAQSKAIIDNIRKDFSFTDLGDSSLFDILYQIDENTADTVVLADNLEFEKALKSVTTMSDKASAASALSYIALCIDFTEIEFTDNMHQTMNGISQKWVKQSNSTTPE